MSSSIPPGVQDSTPGSGNKVSAVKPEAQGGKASLRLSWERQWQVKDRDCGGAFAQENPSSPHRSPLLFVATDIYRALTAYGGRCA